MDQTVSIVVAAYRAAELLPTSIASAHAQKPDCEIVVVDDASNDDTPEVMANYPEVKFLSLSQNGGPSVARNAGFAAASGDWLAVLDADDDMVPGRISRMLDIAVETQADVVLGNLLRVDETGEPIDDGPFFDITQISKAPLTLEDYVTQNLLERNETSTGYLKPMFKRAFLEQHGIQYDPLLRNSEDYHIILEIIAAGGRVVIAPEPDYLYRVAKGSISHVVNPAYLHALESADRNFMKRALSSRKGAERRHLSHLFARRMRNLQGLLVGEEVMRALKKRRPDTAIGLILRNPATLGSITHKFAEAVGKRLSRPRTKPS